MEDEHNQPREVELKLAVPGDAADALAEVLRSRTAAAGDERRRHEVTTYFDTPDQALRRSGISLRVRCIDGRYVQTMKANGRDGVAADRAEWEWPVARDKPDLGLLEQTPLARELPRKLDLKPVFATEIDRTTRLLDLDGGTVAEAAYDEGLIRTGHARQPVRELELELRNGDVAPLYRLALELHAAVPLMFESESKAARGYRLKSGAAPVARKAEDIPLDSRTNAADALQKILSAGLGHLLANQPAALAGDAEGIHQMRVAIRRLRAALTLFQPHLEPHATALFQGELRRVGQVFGEARDWDVFCQQILPDTLEAAHAAAWHDVLLRPAGTRRDAAHAKFDAEVRGPAFTGLVLGLAARAEERCLLDEPVRTQPIADLCPVLLDRLARKVDRRGRHIGRQTDTERHALRKSLKKLRYGIDFVSPVFSPERLKPYLHDCKKLQQSLGDINDSVTAIALAEQLVGETRPDLAPAAGALAEQLDRRRDDGLRGLAKRWKAFSDQDRFWT